MALYYFGAPSGCSTKTRDPNPCGTSYYTPGINDLRTALALLSIRIPVLCAFGTVCLSVWLLVFWHFIVYVFFSMIDERPLTVCTPVVYIYTASGALTRQAILHMHGPSVLAPNSHLFRVLSSKFYLTNTTSKTIWYFLIEHLLWTDYISFLGVWLHNLLQ